MSMGDVRSSNTIKKMRTRFFLNVSAEIFINSRWHLPDLCGIVQV